MRCETITRAGMSYQLVPAGTVTGSSVDQSHQHTPKNDFIHALAVRDLNFAGLKGRRGEVQPRVHARRDVKEGVTQTVFGRSGHMLSVRDCFRAYRKRFSCI